MSATRPSAPGSGRRNSGELPTPPSLIFPDLLIGPSPRRCHSARRAAGRLECRRGRRTLLIVGRWPWGRRGQQQLSVDDRADDRRLVETPTSRDVVIEAITTFVPSSPDRTAREIRLGSLLAGTPTSWLPGLDYEIRWRATWRSHPWETMTVAEVSRFLRRSDGTAVAAGLSMHRNGHIRELAVRRLAKSGDPKAFRWLVLRCGDWVPVVRDAALAAVESIVVPANAAQLVDVLPLLGGGRFEPGRPAAPLTSMVEAVLTSSPSRPAVERGLVSSDRCVRRGCARLLASADPTPELLALVLPLNDVVATSLLLRGLPTHGAASRDVGALLCRSPMAGFRAEGLWRVLHDETSDGAPAARQALLDQAPAVRDIAQRWLAARGEDPRATYLPLLADRPAIALAGLGDRPAAEDAPLARAAVDSDQAAVRLSALRLLATLGSPTDEALFAARFQDGPARERRHALAGIRRCGAQSRLTDSLWTTAVERNDARQTARILFQIVPALGIWRRIHYGLGAIGSANPEIVEQGLETLRRATTDPSRGYRASPPDLDDLRERLQRPQHVVKSSGGARLDAHLEFLLNRNGGT